MTLPTSPLLVELKNLSFGYGDRVILNEISFGIPRGKVTALMGVSGGGKSGKKKSKKEKAEEEERAREKRISDHHAGAGPSERDVELGKLEAILSPLGLAVHDIAADGHCLYRSLAHQLQAGGEPIDFTQCRADIAAYMRKHPHDFEPYLEEGCTDFGAYCETVEHSSEWGGQLEIAALAHARKQAESRQAELENALATAQKRAVEADEATVLAVTQVELQKQRLPR